MNPFAIAGAVGAVGIGAAMWPWGRESGVDIFDRNFDIDAGVDTSAIDILPEGLLKSLRGRSVGIGAGVSTRITRQKALGLSRARGASNVPGSIASARNIRRKTAVTLDKLLGIARNKRKQVEMKEISTALTAMAQKQSIMGQYATSKKRADMGYARGLGSTYAGETASKKRAAMNVAASGLAMSIPFMGGEATAKGAIIGGGVGKAMSGFLGPTSQPVLQRPMSSLGNWLPMNGQDGAVGVLPPMYTKDYDVNDSLDYDLGIGGDPTERYRGILDMKL